MSQDTPPAPVPTAAPTKAVSSLASLTMHQRETALARLAFVREIDRLAVAVRKEKAIRQLVDAARDGSLPPRLAGLVAVANDRMADGRGLTRRRLYGWCSLFAEGGEAALAPKHKGKDMAVPAWAPAFLAIWQQPQKPTIADAYNQFADAYEGIPPSIFAVRRFLAKMADTDREAGRDTGNALLKRRPHKRRSTDELWPTDVYTADGTTFDAEIQHPVHGQPFKPEVTFVLDVATRRCVGLSIGEAESAGTVLDALRMACLFGGIPALFYTDNGPGYVNNIMLTPGSGMLDRLGIDAVKSIPGRPQGKSLMERAVQTLCDPLSKRLPSCSHADMDGDAAKKVFKITRADVKKHGKSRLLPTWETFKAALLARVEEYNAAPHRGLARIDDQANPAGYVDLSRLVVAPGWQPSFNFSYGVALAWESATLTETSLAGAEHFEDRPPYRVVSFRLGYMDRVEGTNQALAMTRALDVSGEVFFVFDPANPLLMQQRSFLGRLRRLSPLEHVACNINGMAFEIKEVVA